MNEMHQANRRRYIENRSAPGGEEILTSDEHVLYWPTAGGLKTIVPTFLKSEAGTPYQSLRHLLIFERVLRRGRDCGQR